jgi:predicted metal-dependent peptidase
MDLSPLFKTLMRKFPEVEPYLYLMPHRVVSAQQWSGPKEMTTAYTDGRECVYHEEFFTSLSQPKQLGLILHEVFHNVYADTTIVNAWVDKTVTPASFYRLRNIAMDIRLENSIWELAQEDMPGVDFESLQVQPNYDIETLKPYKGWAWRDIYEDLKRKNPPKPGGDGSSWGDGLPDQLDNHEQFGELSKAEQLEHDRLVKRAKEQSDEIHERLRNQGQGRGEGVLAIKPEAPTVSWLDILRDHLSSIPSKQYSSWQKLSRRALSRGVYEQSLVGTEEALHRVTMMIDTSGSMHGTLNKVAGDILDLLNQMQVAELDLVYYDTGILDRQVVEDLSNFTISSMPSGGGTQIAGALEEMVSDEAYTPCPLVVLTDGYDDYGIPQSVKEQLGPVVFVSYGQAVTSNVGPCVVVNS